MACGNTVSNNSERYKKSSLTSVNTSTQAVLAAGTTLNCGTTVQSSGLSIAAGANGHKIVHGGLFRAEAAVTITAAGAGTVTVEMLLAGNVLPCSVRQMTVASGDTVTIPTDAPSISVDTCAAINPEITVMVLGVAGAVGNFMQNTLKLA